MMSNDDDENSSAPFANHFVMVEEEEDLSEEEEDPPQDTLERFRRVEDDSSQEEEDDDDEEEDLSDDEGPPNLINRALVYESSSSEEEESDDEREVVHYGVSCDECGVSPIRGSVYHSTRIVDYDICQECYEENHKDLTMADAFAVIHRRRNFNEEDYFGEDYRLMRRDAYDWGDLETELRSNDGVQNLDVNFNYGGFRGFLLGGRTTRTPLTFPTEESMAFVQNAIAASTKLRVIYLESPNSHHEEYSDAMAALLSGIAASQTIVTLSVKVDFRWTSVAHDLCHIIRTNQSIRFLFLRHRYRAMDNEERDGPRVQYLRREFLLQQEGQVRAAALPFFQSLAYSSSLHLFLCGGVEGLGEECRTAATHALRTRPNLKRIKASFANEEDTTLQQLMEEKKQHWMQDWNDPDASNASRVQVLQEILSCKQVEEQDQVAALFHFVRSNPGALPS
jgi:Zinc finger, ZZ type